MASLSVRGKLRLAVLVKITTPLMVVLALPYLTVLTPAQEEDHWTVLRKHYSVRETSMCVKSHNLLQRNGFI